MKKGLIIIGYTGIGKTEFSKMTSRTVDLESSCFYVNNERAENWYVPYCQLAMSIANQGQIVFVSSHPEVIDTLHTLPMGENVRGIVIICPQLYLRFDWSKRLHDRYEKTKLEKDAKALEHVDNSFGEDIAMLANAPFPVYQIADMKYDLWHYVTLIEECYMGTDFDFDSPRWIPMKRT